ncbi:SusD/RagB family nutrient-binding outer membrane lipoprotein [Galbibacter sp. BG1]|uniref:SusD/RagB family nutrient-binding outer membrane lipoprotein n=1 Tax=Galbibacter sp. BG1 TaxID=1170699 RepID=UPI0015BDC521|nr:SusD/RagB family nutrient-binding outer membrane lipoprotein [Galbibacter sp. BG1]QLE02443.1 SusD/RagB family nutrient-binding outer membrane lipoprotein [Galbibacter sp. BG1]
MNKLSNNIILLALLFLGMISCTRDFEDINTNPNQFSTATPNALMTGAMKTSLDLVGGEMNLWMFLSYARYAGGLQGNEFHSFGIFEQFVNNYWRDLYVDAIKPCESIMEIYGEDPNYSNRVEVAKIWASYNYSIIISTWGPVPISQALSIDNLPDVLYDTEEEAYTIILDRLKEASASIDPSGDTFINNQDVLYGGDMTKWKKFANTLRLKIALRIVDAFPALASQHINEVIANESLLIMNPSENAMLSWGDDQQNWSTFYNQQTIIQNENHIPKINDDLYLYLNTYNDPRITAFAAEAEEKVRFVDSLEEGGGSSTKIAVEYAVPYLGEPLGTNANRTLDAWGLNEADNPIRDYVFENYSNYNNEFMKADASFTIISSEETMFMLSELALKGFNTSNSAENYYINAIKASFARYNVSGVDDYLTQDGIAWGTTSTGQRNYNGIVTTGITTNLERIITQRWIAMFFQGHDGWCLQKRTREIDWAPFLNPADRLGVDFLDFPERMAFPLSEIVENPNGYQDGVNKLGGEDNLVTKLKMNSTEEGINWNNADASFNSDYISEYYGPSVDDLLSNGLIEVDLTTGTPQEIQAKQQLVNDGKAFVKL